MKPEILLDLFVLMKFLQFFCTNEFDALNGDHRRHHGLRNIGKGITHLLHEFQLVRHLANAILRFLAGETGTGADDCQNNAKGGVRKRTHNIYPKICECLPGKVTWRRN